MSQKRSSSKPDEPRQSEAPGAPRWTYVLAAIVGAATLAWAVVSHFLAPDDKVVSAPVLSIQSAGDGNANIGVNTGQISIGVPAPRSVEPPATPRR